MPEVASIDAVPGYAAPLISEYFGAKYRRSTVHGVGLLFSAGSTSPRTTSASPSKAVEASG